MRVQLWGDPGSRRSGSSETLCQVRARCQSSRTLRYHKLARRGAACGREARPWGDAASNKGSRARDTQAVRGKAAYAWIMIRVGDTHAPRVVCPSAAACACLERAPCCVATGAFACPGKRRARPIFGWHLKNNSTVQRPELPLRCQCGRWVRFTRASPNDSKPALSTPLRHLSVSEQNALATRASADTCACLRHNCYAARAHVAAAHWQQQAKRRGAGRHGSPRAPTSTARPAATTASSLRARSSASTTAPPSPKCRAPRCAPETTSPLHRLGCLLLNRVLLMLPLHPP